MIYNGLIQTIEYFCLPTGDLTLYAFSSSVRFSRVSMDLIAPGRSGPYYGLLPAACAPSVPCTLAPTCPPNTCMHLPSYLPPTPSAASADRAQGSGWGGSTLDLYAGSSQHIVNSASLVGTTTAFGATTITVPQLPSSAASQPYPLSTAPGSSMTFTYGYMVSGRNCCWRKGNRKGAVLAGERALLGGAAW